MIHYDVFISATSDDLADERKALAEIVRECQCEPEIMDAWPGSGLPVQTTIQERVDKADIFVTIVAGRYGSLVRDGLSYTELEYEHAKAKGIPVIVLLKHHDTISDSARRGSAEERRLRAFVDKLKRDNTPKVWRTREDLVACFRNSLTSVIFERQATSIVTSNGPLDSEVVKYVNDRTKLGRKPAQATIVQYSGENIKDIVRSLLAANIDVDLYLVEDSIAQALNAHQAEIVTINRRKLRNRVRSGSPGQSVGRLRTFRYKTPGSLRLVMIDEDFLAIGSYIYRKERIEGKQVLDICGGELPMIIVRSEHAGFSLFKAIVNDMIDNWKKHKIVRLDRMASMASFPATRPRKGRLAREATA